MRGEAGVVTSPGALPTLKELSRITAQYCDSAAHESAIADDPSEQCGRCRNEAEAILARLRPAFEQLESPGEAERDAAGLCMSEANRWRNHNDPRTYQHWESVAQRLAAGHLATTVMRKEIDALRADLARLQKERDDIAYRVEHPEKAHLHYEGCPYQPWADKPRWEEPEDIPECTCGEAAKGAYWKGQHLLERGHHEMTKADLRACAEALTFIADGVTEVYKGNLGMGDFIDAIFERCRAALTRPGMQEARK